jgi:hypothetical protein
MTGGLKLERRAGKVTGTAENQYRDVSSSTGRNILPNHSTLLQGRIKWEDLNSIHKHFLPSYSEIMYHIFLYVFPYSNTRKNNI